VQVLIIGHPADLSFDVAQSLSELGVDWRVSLAADASEALRAAQAQAPDVVVCGMNPVGMTGIALLTLIRARAPQAVRLMLLDDDEAEQATKALAVAHRLLHRPLRAEELIDAVESIADLREILDSPALKAAIGRIERLPPPPQLYFKLGRTMDDPDASMSAVTQLVAEDPITAAKALRTSNSAFFSGGRTTTDVRSAVLRLGPRELQRMVLAAEVFHGESNTTVDYEALRQRSLLSAQLASRMVSSASAEMAATAALLAEVGMLLPGVRIPDHNGELVGEGPHYAEAGAYLLGLWGLPMPIVEAVANHHHPRRARARGFWIDGAVHVARALAAGQPVDTDFLASVGVADRLPEWRRLARELAANMQTEDAASEPVPVPLADGSGARATRVQRAADYLLRKQAIAELACDGVIYTMLGGEILSPSSAEAVEYLLKSRPFDAVAVDLCEARLQAQPVGSAGLQPLPLAQMLRSGLDASTLGRQALALLRLRLAEQSGMDPAAYRNEAIEGARQRRLPILAIDRSLDLTLQRALQPLWPIRRVQILWHLVSLGRHLPPVERRILQFGDAVAGALYELGVERSVLQRVCFAERDRHMARSLRDQATGIGAARVLVVVGRGHLDGLAHDLMGLASDTAKPPATAP
jgi:HD-like signal output (HDOD) protein/CheY-like chemotaxis protein